MHKKRKSIVLFCAALDSVYSVDFGYVLRIKCLLAFDAAAGSFSILATIFASRIRLI